MLHYEIILENSHQVLGEPSMRIEPVGFFFRGDLDYRLREMIFRIRDDLDRIDIIP